MSKREHTKINGAAETQPSRPKRRRESGESSSEIDRANSDPFALGNGVSGTGGVAGGASVKEQGLKLWQTMKDATKDGRSLTTVFLKKPSKKLYPEYYTIIAHPIAFDDIRKGIETGEYGTLEEVKDAFNLCFENAKQFNLEGSIIWLDAKELQKLVNKTYSKMVPSDDGGDKSKTPNLHRLIKARLERLVAKTDADGRVLSDIFMALPSRKDWPSYYATIKNPQCLENIFKHIKRKEYETAAEFAADVELVFSNAMTFNEDHSIIWQDAVTLRDYFRQLMSDMPPPFSIPEYAKPNKIKIRPPQAQASASSSALPAKAEPSTSSLTLRVPAQHPPKAVTPASVPKSHSTPKPTPTTKAHVVQKNAAPSTPVSAASRPTPAAPVPKQAAAAIVPKPVAPQAPVPKVPKAATPQPAAQLQNISFINATSTHYPHVAYATPTAAVAPVVATPPALRSSSILNAQAVSHSPTPAPIPLNHHLKTVDVRMQPSGRSLELDHRDGVKSWLLRLVKGETSVLIKNVTFMGDEEEEDSEAEEETETGKHEEEEEGDMDVDVEGDGSPSTKNGRTTRPKRRGRGRPPKASTAAAKATAAKVAKAASVNSKKKATTSSKVGEVQCKVNGQLVKAAADHPGQWEASILVGATVVEVGESGGMIWKIYVERPSEA